MTRTAVLVSGSGRSLANLLRREQQGELPTETVLVISSTAGVAALQHAADFGVPSLVLKSKDITTALDDAGVQLVIMAGFLRRWPIPDRYVGRTINIHPSLLPPFGGKGMYGHHVHEAVLESGMRVSGCTVHFVTDDYDQGPIIGQRSVPVHWDDGPDTLAARVFEKERELLPECVALVANGEVVYESERAIRRPR